MRLATLYTGVVVWCLMILAGARPANASFIYVSDVESVSGTFGAPGLPLSSGAAAAAVTLGAPDDSFIQLSDNTQIVLSFGSLISEPGTLRVFTFDTLAPAAATIEISSDNVTFTELTPPPGELWYDSNASGFIDISVSTDFQYVRLTDLPGSVDGDFVQNGTVGFDLDAVGFTAVPEPSSLALFGMATFGAILIRRRQPNKSRL